MCGSGSSCDPNEDGQTCSTQSCTPTSACRRNEGQTCDETNGDFTDDCYTGLECTGGTCSTPTNATTDLAIAEIIPIQVIPDVNMVKDKSGYVVVNVTNTGDAARAYVRAWFNGNQLTFSSDIFENIQNTNNRSIAANSSGLFVFDFTPGTAGTNLIVNATVEVGE